MELEMVKLISSTEIYDTHFNLFSLSNQTSILNVNGELWEVKEIQKSVPVLFGVGVWWCPKVANTGPTGKEDGRCSDLHNWVGSRRYEHVK